MTRSTGSRWLLAALAAILAACSPGERLCTEPAVDAGAAFRFESGLESVELGAPRLEDDGMWAQDLTGEGWDTLPVRPCQENRITYMVAATPLER